MSPNLYAVVPTRLERVQLLESTTRAQITRQFIGRYTFKLFRTEPPYRWKYLVTIWDAQEERAYVGRMRNVAASFEWLFQDFLVYLVKRQERCAARASRRLERAHRALDCIFEEQPELRERMRRRGDIELSDSESDEEEDDKLM